MNKKIFIQIGLFSLILLIIFVAYSYYFETLKVDVLKSNPSKAPQIFQSFGKSFNGDDMAFFMSSKIKIIPILKMIFNLPTKIFIKSFIRCLFNG